MKLSLKVSAVVLAAVFAVQSEAAKTPKKENKPMAKAAEVLKIDAAASQVLWVGKKVTGAHNGAVAVKEGTVEIGKAGIQGGTIVVDLNSITAEDVKDPEWNKKLVDHLKGEDFFHAEKFPTATFKIKSGSEIMNIKEGEPNLEVKGDLTIRGTTKPFTAKMFYTPNDSGFETKGKIVIDRTQFGLKYSSGKFFDPKKLGDKMINDQFEVELKLVAKK